MEILRAHIPLLFGLGFLLLFTIATQTDGPLKYTRDLPSSPEIVSIATTSEETPPPLKEAEVKPEPPPNPKPEETEEKTSSESKPQESVPQAPVKQEVVTPLPVEIVSPPPGESVETLNDKARRALVNVFCISKSGSKLPSFSGSGIVIDPRGIVVTNAHVAEHMLLKNYQMPNALECVLRTGSPARNTYTTELIYLPPTWVYTNASQITSSNPTGTGEDDYAFLRITGTTDGSPLPSAFSSVPIEVDETQINTWEDILVAAYPAGFIGDQNIETALYPVTNLSRVGTLYTFNQDTLDLISLGNIAVSQKGSSGGGAINAFGKLIALIVTTSDGATTAERDLRGITFSHVSRSLIQNAGYSLETFLAKDPASQAIDFETHIAPPLRAALTAEYDKR